MAAAAAAMNASKLVSRQESTMGARIASRFLSRRMSSTGRVLSKEEKAAENVYIKKLEQEKLEKLARKGPEESVTNGAGSTNSAPKPINPTAETGGAWATARKYLPWVGGAIALAAAGTAGFFFWEKKSSETKVLEIKEEVSPKVAAAT